LPPAAHQPVGQVRFARDLAHCSPNGWTSRAFRAEIQPFGEQGCRINHFASKAKAGRWWRARPLRRCVTPDEVAATILSLITGNPFVTGEVIIVDGGFSSVR